MDKIITWNQHRLTVSRQYVAGPSLEERLAEYLSRQPEAFLAFDGLSNQPEPTDPDQEGTA